MRLFSRPPRLDDFDVFFATFFSKACHDAVLRQSVAHEWRILLENPATVSLLIEEAIPGGGHRMVGCGQLAFVSPQFVQWVRRGERPWVNAHATHQMPDGSWPLLSPAEVRRAQNAEGVSGLITRWVRADYLLGPEKFQVNAFMDNAFQDHSQGYPYRELLIEAIGGAARSHALASGFVERADYMGYYQAHPPLPPDEVRPYLMGITREEAMSKEGSRIAAFFWSLPPQFAFSPKQLDLLYRAMRGDSDEIICQSLPLSRSGLKKRWQTIYTRVTTRMPELFRVRSAEADETDRGREKRRLLLEYLREHPEELRAAGGG